jgi:hypothetical protein
MSAAASLARVVELHPDPPTPVSYDTERPTQAQYMAFQRMFSYFNAKLFDGSLPEPMLTFSRKSKASGFFAPDRWSARDDEKRGVSEIAVNPDHLKSEPPVEIASTLVHEMAHLWQHTHGKPSRPGYHNNEWSSRMESIGLQPSATGEPGGRRVGQKMSDYPIPGGLFETAFGAMPDSWFFPFLSKGTEREKKPSTSDSSKSKFLCPTCGDIARGKPSLLISCIKCRVAFVRDGETRAGTGSQPAAEERQARSAPPTRSRAKLVSTMRLDEVRESVESNVQDAIARLRSGKPDVEPAANA